MTTHTTADTRLELFDGARWVPMEFPAFEDYTFEVICERARLYVERGAAKSVRVQLRKYDQWLTVKTISMTIVETDSGEIVIEPSAVCTCGHMRCLHVFGEGMCNRRHCSCLGFEVKEV